MNEYEPWEWRTEQEMQDALAGSMLRADYLRDRLVLASRLPLLLDVRAHHDGLEIGPGEGIVAASIAPRCRSLLCADISRSFLSKTAESCAGQPNVLYSVIGDDFLDSLPSAAFDFGYAANVFVHLDAYGIFHYLRGVTRVLRPGGRFWFNACAVGVNTIDLFRTFAAAYRAAPKDRVPGYLRWNDVGTIRQLIREAGLRECDGGLIDDGGGIEALVARPGERQPDPPSGQPARRIAAGTGQDDQRLAATRACAGER